MACNELIEYFSNDIGIHLSTHNFTPPALARSRLQFTFEPYRTLTHTAINIVFKHFNHHPVSSTAIEEANWLTLYDDIQPLVGSGFDAVICLGNSFAHMIDNFGDQREQKQAIGNFEKCLKPGGFLLIDHRNYDNIMETGATPSKCIYYNVSLI